MNPGTSTWLILLATLAITSVGQATPQSEATSTAPVSDAASDYSDDDFAAPAATPTGTDDKAVTPMPGDRDTIIVPTDTIEAAYTRFDRLRDEGRKDEATVAALQVAELTQRRYGADAIELATPLINLAVMQSQTGDVITAEQNYRAAIAIIERHEGMLSSRLINPLRGLGYTYNRAGLHEKAIESFDRALRLNHVELGFTNSQQFSIQDGLTESYMGLQEFEEARFYQEAQLEINQRKFGRDNPQVVPAMYKLAKWYSSTGNLDESTLTYRSADRIIRQAEGETSIARTEALMGLAYLYEQQGNRPAAASVLRKAVKLVDTHAEPDKLQRAKLRMALGDLHTRETRSELAKDEYVQAWSDLSSDTSYLEQRDEYFELPVRLSGGPFPNLARNARGKTGFELQTGFVLMGYTVDANGRAQDVKVLESEPPDIMEKSLKTTYRRSTYRPRFLDGVPVATENLLSRHDFRYAGETGTKQTDKGELPPPKKNTGRIERPDKAGAD